jgi:hypothetical protein
MRVLHTIVSTFCESVFCVCVCESGNANKLRTLSPNKYISFVLALANGVSSNANKWGVFWNQTKAILFMDRRSSSSQQNQRSRGYRGSVIVCVFCHKFTTTAWGVTPKKVPWVRRVTCRLFSNPTMNPFIHSHWSTLSSGIRPVSSVWFDRSRAP